MSSQNTYFKTIRDESTLAQASQGRPNLATLLQSSDWKSAVSKWGRRELIAHRVVCGRSVPFLPFLKKFQNSSVIAPNDCITRLINGPGRLDHLVHSAEAQLVQRFQPESLGYVWAAMRPFMEISAPTTATTGRPSRECKKPERYEGGVASNPADLGSSPDSGPETSSSDSSFSTVGYTEKSAESPLEDDTIQLASAFLRCVLNHAQAINKQGPFVEFRSRRIARSYGLGLQQINAADDGGIQIHNPTEGEPLQVALLEGKRTFTKITEGEPDVPDGLLAQMVGETLALERFAKEPKNEAPRRTK
ncbi:hypothetical protein OCS_06291 [Ophiocordyceps sinensis CO18]|uniref:Uncharacterized protein n=1 Tax=Ophiocordyceps sinensis (strain Co18 / CGMCC 3.14243) TaxID=911162 RepID=T5A5X1_OPHSC|nr:hypothetical protein OCS_06291 [Ophiocordyceps sinensis CO18]